ncbi:MAG: hypothetical protein Q7K57_18700 [Burkholderiaceae bacterium]|uniref:hypothetical protein n=1 Tax=Polaromonas sp. TaxID=1869339 RepID=UPI002487ED54|nr:hypothetical protein [Polaromonas sp.]MDI1340349.1 hypothetical protein [Polaromonas sp.]MDO8770694.1 hypothetical protein [Burkholderiaceae bacterium]
MIYKKTAQGQAELADRKAGLRARERSALIMVNGQLSIESISAQLGPDAPALLEILVSKELIERAEHPPPPEAAPVKVSITPASSPAVIPAPPSSGPDMGATKLRALRVLAEVYGPEASSMVDDLLTARSLKEFYKAMKNLEEMLVMYQGRKHATVLIQRITGHD